MYSLVCYVPESHLEQVKAVQAMLAAHPYEVPAYHLIPVLTLDEA